MDYNAEKVKDAIHRRVLTYMSAHPDADFDAALKRVTGLLDKSLLVEEYDATKGECVLYDMGTGRHGKGPCEPVHKEPVRADHEVAARVSKYQADHKTVGYADALVAVLREDDALAKVYKTGPGQLFYGDEQQKEVL